MVKIATKVWEEQEFVLQDDSVVKVRPLNIKTLRKFMEVVSKIGEGDSATEREAITIEAIFEAAVIALTKDNPEIVKDTDALSEILDVQTIHKILEVAGGVKLNDTNLTGE